MMDSNDEIQEGNDLQKFLFQTDLHDSVQNLNPDLLHDKTYIHGAKRIDHIFMTQDLIEIALKAGHHQFCQHFISDHKGIYIHFKASSLFNQAQTDNSHHSHRSLNLTERQTVDLYVQHLERIYDDNRFLPRLEKLVDDIDSATSQHLRQTLFHRLNKMDKEREQYMLAAERRAGKKKSYGIHEWSPTLERAGRKVTYWKLRMFQSKGGDVSDDRLLLYTKEQHIQDNGSMEKKYILSQLSKAWRDLRKVQKRSAILREEHLEALAEYYAQKHQTTKMVEIKKLRHTEQVIRVAEKHKWYLKE